MSESQKTRKSSQSSIHSNTSTNVPKTYEEFLAVNNLEDWPAPLTSEGPLPIEENNLGFGEVEDIYRLLSEAAPPDYSAFDDLADRLEDIEKLLHKYADTVIVRPDARPEALDEASEKLFLTETGEAERQKAVKHKIKPQESISEIKKRSIDFCHYPGFLKNELNELPGQLEAPQILNAVTKVQDFNSGFRKFWQKIFLSEASVAVMQDLFWWYFIHKFDPKKTEDKLKLFDRIADSFVALFFSVNPEVKDKVFQVYADCLTQAVLVAFHNAFPESTKRFDERFIDDLVHICIEWITGVKPAPEAWKTWDIQKLVQSPHRTREKRKEIKAPSAASAFHGGMNLSLDMEGFHRVVNRLGDDRRRSFQISGKRGADRSPQTSRLSFNLYGPGSYSHPVGQGAQLETVSFDTLGRSALVTHFLRQRKLQSDTRPQLKVKRTQVAKLPAKTQTYQELIDDRVFKAEMLSRQYQQAVLENEEEILKIQREKAKMNREINQLSRQILFNKNPVEIKIMSEKVLDMMDRPAAPQAAVPQTDRTDTTESDQGDDKAGDNNKLKIQIISPD